MTLRQIAGLVVLLAGLFFAFGQEAAAGGKSDKVVKATASAGKADSDGKQVVTIVLEVESPFYLYANPVGKEDLEAAQTTVTATGKTKLVKVDYPAGETKTDKVLGDYKVYKGKVTIKATVRRGKGDTGALGLAVKLQACDNKRCLFPATIKLSVP